MSYILDALNKVEQSQRNHHTPKLDAMQQISQHASLSRWFVVASIIVLINIGALWFWMNQDSTPPVIDTTPVRLASLPVDIQRQIPDMSFSSHIYASDTTLRMVNINNREFYEGDTIAPGISLNAITEDGVVLNYKQYTFTLPVIHDWTFE
ncbi:MAG: general secretion pathway protein GspB [Pseudomonadales bacterium]|jgi:hypothetical protein|nr:general secretion pathway protein GspB [Pseudomonadales bacterium]